MHKNILTVVGITILFLGISIQPAIAVNPISSDNEEDCNICPKVSKQHLVRLKSLIDKLEINDNKLLVMSNLNPKVAEKYQELSDRITSFTEKNKEYLSNLNWDFPIICGIIVPVILLAAMGEQLFCSMYENYIESNPVLSKIFFPICVMMNSFFIISMLVALVLDCIEFGPL